LAKKTRDQKSRDTFPLNETNFGIDCTVCWDDYSQGCVYRIVAEQKQRAKLADFSAPTILSQ
jgi:hypothetical protein